jgi:hypothetical protein
MVEWWQAGKTTVVNMTFTAFPTDEAQQGNDVKLPHGRWEVRNKVIRLYLRIKIQLGRHDAALG